MSETTLTVSAAEKARKFFAEENLPFPNLSSTEERDIVVVDDVIFSTVPIDVSPYSMNIYISRYLSGETPSNYLIFGFAGSGLASSAVHYYLVADGLAVFIQVSWGGAYTDEDASRTKLTAVFDWMDSFKAKVAHARQIGVLPDGWRVLVKYTDFDESGWAIVPPNIKDYNDLDLETDTRVSVAVMATLDNLINGKATVTTATKG